MRLKLLHMCTPSSKVRKLSCIGVRRHAQIENCLQVAVGAFRVIAEFELKRLGNDKRVSMLFFEMQNMMHALLQ